MRFLEMHVKVRLITFVYEIRSLCFYQAAVLKNNTLTYMFLLVHIHAIIRISTVQLFQLSRVQDQQFSKIFWFSF